MWRLNYGTWQELWLSVNKNRRAFGANGLKLVENREELSHAWVEVDLKMYLKNNNYNKKKPIWWTHCVCCSKYNSCFCVCLKLLACVWDHVVWAIHILNMEFLQLRELSHKENENWVDTPYLGRLKGFKNILPTMLIFCLFDRCFERPYS